MVTATINRALSCERSHSSEEWGFDTELEDGTPVVITFDSQGTDSRYDDVIISVNAINE